MLYNDAMRAFDWTATSYADPATAAFVVIPVLLLAVLMWGTAVAWNRRASLAIGAAITAWMALTWIAAESGVLRNWNAVPPRFALLVLGILAISCAIAFSSLGRALTRHLPLWTLIAVQAFRLPLELAMHTMSERGVMPEQMTYTGLNFDILTGVTAVAVSLALRSRIGNRRLALLWNLGGLALLLNVVTIAILSTPTFALFGPDRLNVWITCPPYVWLPAVMVTAALTGHLLIFRALLMTPRP